MSILDNEKTKKVYEAGKDCVKAVSSMGIGVIFGAFAQTFMPEVGLPVKWAVWLGTKCFEGMMEQKTEEYIDSTLDGIVGAFDEALEEMEEAEASGD